MGSSGLQIISVIFSVGRSSNQLMCIVCSCASMLTPSHTAPQPSSETSDWITIWAHLWITVFPLGGFATNLILPDLAMKTFLKDHHGVSVLLQLDTFTMVAYGTHHLQLKWSTSVTHTPHAWQTHPTCMANAPHMHGTCTWQTNNYAWHHTMHVHTCNCGTHACNMAHVRKIATSHVCTKKYLALIIHLFWIYGPCK